MKIAMKYFLMAALALLMTACSNDDNELVQQPAGQPAKAEGIPFTATISLDKSASTRVLAEDGVNKKLVATWATGEKVALIYDAGGTPTKTEAEVTAQGDGTATISATLASGATDGSNVTIIYPSTAADGTTGNVKATLLNTQEGTLDAVAANYDVRKGTGKLSIGAGGATVNNGTPGTTVSLTNQFAIWKLTLGSAAKNLCIMADNMTIAGATLATAGTQFYVAVPAVSSKTITIVANDESNNCWYYSKAGVSLTAAKYYQSSPSMTTLDTDNNKAVYKIAGTVSSNVTIPDGKTVVLSDVYMNEIKFICSGNANIILMGDNYIDNSSYYNYYPAILIGGEGTTLTIQGSGKLTARGAINTAGIGTRYADHTNSNVTGGNIIINGGTVIATGGENGAGIGTGCALGFTVAASNTCGNITINGGTVTAKGGEKGACIGTGCSNGQYIVSSQRCGTITIGAGVTSVTVRKGNSSTNSIGKGESVRGGTQTCGTITFGAAQVFDGSVWSPATMVNGSYGGLNLAITTTYKTDDTWTLTPAP